MQTAKIAFIESEDRAALLGRKLQDQIVGYRVPVFADADLSHRHHVVSEFAKEINDLYREVLIGKQPAHWPCPQFS